MAHKLRIALLQMDIAIGQPDVNYSRLQNMLLEAMEQQPAPDIILLPELWNTGYALDEIKDLADADGIRTCKMIGEFCRKHHVNIIAGSIAELNQDKVRNTIFVHDRMGTGIGRYSKMHLFRLMDEEKFLVSGDMPGNLTIEGIPAGMMICYDIRFPELARKYALGGAKILFVPAEWPKPRLHHWRTLMMARAIENQMYVVACNRVGTSGTTEFFGHSMVVDPWGDVLVEGDETESILSVDIDLDLVDEVRGRIPVFEDRRPELY